MNDFEGYIEERLSYLRDKVRAYEARLSNVLKVYFSCVDEAGDEQNIPEWIIDARRETEGNLQHLRGRQFEMVRMKGEMGKID